MSLVLIVLLILLLCGGGFGIYSGAWGPGAPYNPIGIVLFVFLILVLVSLLGPWPMHRYW